MMVWMGTTSKMAEIPIAIKLGSKAYLGNPSGARLDQVRLPKL